MTRIFTVFGIFLYFFFASCSSQATSKTKKPTVLVSVAPYAFFIDKISQGSVDVHIVAKEKSNPHFFEPTPKDVEEAYSASLWIRTGEFFENKIARCLEENQIAIAQVNIASAYKEHTHSHAGKCQCKNGDLHFWMSPTKAREQILWIKDALSKALPEHKAIFDKGYQNLDKELEALALDVKEKLSPFAGQAIIASHPAFGYFCKEFDLQQIPIETDGKEPTAKQILSLIETTKAAAVRAVLIQKTHSSKGALILAKQLKISHYDIDPYSKNYELMINELTDYIIQGSCKNTTP